MILPEPFKINLTRLFIMKNILSQSLDIVVCAARKYEITIAFTLTPKAEPFFAFMWHTS